MAFDLGDYKDVAERLQDLKQTFPEASIQSRIVELPEAFADKFLAVKATVHRTPNDPAPAEGLAWEPVPGQTPYTRNSELQNAETSAWGRAIIAALASESKKIASRQEVEPRQAEREQPTKETPTFDGEKWLKDAAGAFSKWDAADRKAAWKEAVTDVSPGKPMTKMEAEKVFAHMAGAYYAEHPGDEEHLF
jgi:hypothetical protein